MTKDDRRSFLVIYKKQIKMSIRTLTVGTLEQFHFKTAKVWLCPVDIPFHTNILDQQSILQLRCWTKNTFSSYHSNVPKHGHAHFCQWFIWAGNKSTKKTSQAHAIITASSGAPVPGFPNFTSGNVRSILIGGSQDDTASLDDLYITRLFFESSDEVLFSIIPMAPPKRIQQQSLSEFKDYLYRSSQIIFEKVF
jgi:hypothetical protein